MKGNIQITFVKRINIANYTLSSHKETILYTDTFQFNEAIEQDIFNFA